MATSQTAMAKLGSEPVPGNRRLLLYQSFRSVEQWRSAAKTVSSEVRAGFVCCSAPFCGPRASETKLIPGSSGPLSFDAHKGQGYSGGVEPLIPDSISRELLHHLQGEYVSFKTVLVGRLSTTKSRYAS